LCYSVKKIAVTNNLLQQEKGMFIAQKNAPLTIITEKEKSRLVILAWIVIPL
jgi:hypothetical protein